LKVSPVSSKATAPAKPPPTFERQGSLMKVELSAEELAMDGAPEGELFVAVVLERREVLPADDAAAVLAALLEQLQTKAGLGEWFEKFIFSEKTRGLIVHNSSLISPEIALTVCFSTRVGLHVVFLKCLYAHIAVRGGVVRHGAVFALVARKQRRCCHGRHVALLPKRDGWNVRVDCG
jgi:hypothetical protein